jgi:TPR repeat protein
MSDYNDNIGDIDEPDDAWSNLPESFGLWRHRHTEEMDQVILAQQSDNPMTASNGDISEQLAQQVEDEHITCAEEWNNMHITCTGLVDECSNCGKESSNLNVCNKCKAAKYCNAACKKKHRTKHKKKCERRVAELHDIELFKQPLPPEDCPICMLPLPVMDTGSKYKACCGKDICSGCTHAVRLRSNGVSLCPFCRTPTHTSNEENIKRLKKRVEVGDAEAMNILGSCYYEGMRGLARDHDKALELWHQAGKVGCTLASNFCIGHAHEHGAGVERDKMKAKHYYELAAMMGYAKARHNLGNVEFRERNWDRATKHWLIAAGSGFNGSVKNIQQMYMAGHTKKDDYTNALRAYQKYIEEIRSEQRDKAAAYSDKYKYY